MNRLRTHYGNYALVAGAAEGLGAAFSRQLAQLGFNLILVDIKSGELHQLSQDLKNQFGINTHILICDLCSADAHERLMDAWKNHQCRFLIYNAAYGPVKPFLSNSEEELDQYIAINVRTTVKLVRNILANAGDNRTGIMLLSSLAGFRGTSYVIPYAATKAFLWNFTEGCHYEFKEKPYDFSICCPGATGTPNYLSTGARKTTLSPKPASPDSVASEALKYFGKRLFIIPGKTNKFVHFVFSRLLPRKWASTMHNQTMKDMYSGLFDAKPSTDI